MLENISPDIGCCVVIWLEGIKINISSISKTDLGPVLRALGSNIVPYFAVSNSHCIISFNKSYFRKFLSIS